MASNILPYVLDFQNGGVVDSILKKAEQLPSKVQLDALLDAKADSDTVYTKTQVDDLISSIESVVSANRIYYTLESLTLLNTIGTWSDNVYTHSGVTYTVNVDMTITVDGTASAQTSITLGTYSGLNGKKMKGCPSDGGSDKYELQMEYNGGILYHDYGEGGEITHDGDGTAYIIVRNGVSVSNIVFSPMVYDNDTINQSYQTGAPTNRQLYETIGDINSVLEEVL